MDDIFHKYKEIKGKFINHLLTQILPTEFDNSLRYYDVSEGRVCDEIENKFLRYILRWGLPTDDAIRWYIENERNKKIETII